MREHPNIRAIFDKALEIESAEERLAYLAEACGADADVRREVETLLSAHSAAGEFLESSPAAGLSTAADLDPPLMLIAPGTIIGRYKILEPIGEGGYGTVFMAEQTSPVQRRVALKIIKAGMDTRQVIARFEAERQALALMDHPNIAKVFDAGVTDTGRPYFVMELVKGISITKYCDEHKLPPRQRLELFMEVCQAVQHAHQKGIIHRDIKPTNVLVAQYDGKAVPKVIDFGVAKATGQRLTDATMFTGFGDVIGTLEYMSPEQAQVNQLDVDTRSDIYSLGVLLYELLTGSTPLERTRVMKAGLLEMLRVVREEEPPRPSIRLGTTEQLPSIAANRGLEPKKLSGLIHGELDWIVMKSLEKDRARRYETASGFAADVHRYLDDEAVQACPPSARYRFRKFARRHKRRLATAVLLAACLLAGFALLVVNNVRLEAEQARTRVERDRTKTQFERAQGELARADSNLGVALAALDKIFMTEIENRVRRERRLTEESRRVLQQGLDFYEQFAARNSARNVSQGETARAYRRAAEIHMVLSRWPQAESAFRKAIPLFEAIPAESADAAVYRREFAFCLGGLSRALSHQQRTGESIKAIEREMAYWESPAAGASDSPDIRFHLAHCLGQQGILLAQDKRYAEGEQTLARVLELYAKLKSDSPHDRHYRQEWAFTQSSLGMSVMRPTRRLAEAEQHFQMALAAYRALAEELPDDVWYPRCVANELMNLARTRKEMGGSTTVEQLIREAIDVQEKVLARGPPEVNEHRHLLAGYVGELASHLADLERFAEAETLFRRSATIRQKIIAELVDTDDEPERQNQRRLVSDDVVGLIQTLRLATAQASTHPSQIKDERQAAAMKLRARAHDVQRDAAASGILGAGGLNTLAWRIVVKPGAEADDVAWAVEMASTAVRQEPNNANAWHTLAVARYRTGDFKQAIADLQKNMELRNGKGWAYDFFFLAMAWWQLGDKDQARQWYDQAVQWMHDHPTPQNIELPAFRSEAAALLRMGDEDPATKPAPK